MSRPPRWGRVLLRWLAPREEAEDVLGDLEEAHSNRTHRHGLMTARMLTSVETIDIAAALVRARITRFRTNKGSGTLQDYKLGFRMLVKYPGLTLAGGLALAIAIGIGAGWYDLAGDLFRPTLPLPNGDRIVEVEMRNAAASEDERRLLHDFVTWRRDVRLIEDLGAYRTLERTLILGDAQPEPVTVAETTASAFRVAGVPPFLGRPLLEADEQPGAPPVVVLGYRVWQRQFGAREDAIGRTVQLGRAATTVVGVMPEGFAFPVNHRLWVPLHVKPSGYAPLEGVAVRVFGRLAPGATQAQAYAEVTALNDRAAAASPQTHQHLRPRVLAYGGESPGDRSLLELVMTHLPILLVMIVACVNVGTLIYARTATRDAEIAVRYALGASRGRIVGQLFVEALVLASVAAVVGLAAAHWALKLGMAAYYSGMNGGLPFWVDPGLKLTTVLYSAGLTAAGAAILGLLPALKVTGPRVQGQLRNLGAGGSTLQFGKLWTTAMIAQVALTVVCIPPAMGIAHEAWRDRVIRDRFPAEQYLAARVTLDREAAEETSAAFAARLERTYRELERRVAQEPGVVAVTFADRLPGMGPAVREAEVEVSPGAPPISIANLWTSAVGPRFFKAFDVPILAGRDFHDGDRAAGARTVLVNEAFARRYMDGASPVGRQVRYAGNPAAPDPWLEIVGMVRDIGMTPTDLGEAPYVFRAVSPAAAYPLIVGVRMAGDPASLAPRLRTIAAALEPDLRLDDMRSLEDHASRVDVPQMVGAGAIAAVVSLGLFLSAAGIFSLMSVSVARRTREIGLRAALGATQGRLLAGIFSRALVLVGSGIVAGNLALVLFVALEPEVTVADVADALLATSALMLTVGLLACMQPARRALRIHPTEALREA
ncbi:MAG TPA: ABC transporter permease [Vicinamibacterales bacterium]|nr:ABC transporter permease [Vicinamibacterales bacterium]